MKITCLLILLSVIFSNLNAQSTQEEVDLLQSIYGMEKKAVVAEVVKPSASQEGVFWKLYDDYEAARKTLGKERIELLMQYSENFDNLSNKVADELLKASLALSKKHDKLLVSYVRKIRKATNPVVAMQFHQIEMYILSQVRLAITGELPYPEIIPFSIQND